MHVHKTILFTGLILGMAYGAVSGVVFDANTDEPLVGTSVFVKGTFVGTTTNDQGAYSLEAATGDVLVVAYIGYKTQEVTVGDGVSS